MGKILEPNKNAEYGSILTWQSVLCSFVAVNLFLCCRLYDILFFYQISSIINVVWNNFKGITAPIFMQS